MLNEYDIVLRFVDNYGWLGICKKSDKCEVFRTGSYHKDEYAALDAVNLEIRRREANNNNEGNS